MAIENAKVLNVRIKNKYASYNDWINSGLILEAGEIAIAHSTVDVTVGNGVAKQPVLLMKVGDGEQTFANLPWMSAKAADVLSVCKDEKALTDFVNEVIAGAGIATDDAMQALAGRVTTVEKDLNGDPEVEGDTGLKGRVTSAEAAISVLESLMGGTEKSVATQISEAISALNLANTYAAKTHNHTKSEITDFAHTHAIADVTGLSDALNDKAAAAHTHAIADVTGLSDAIADAKKAGTDAKTYAEGVAGDLATLSGKIGDVPEDKTVVQMIADATYDDAALDGRVDALEGKVGQKSVADQISDALKVEDKDGNKVDKYALATDLAAEAEAARLAEKANADAITKLNASAETEGSVDYKIANAVAAIMENPDDTMNSINELVTWVNDHADDALELSNTVTKLDGDVKMEGSVKKQIADAVSALTTGEGAVAKNAADIATLKNNVATIDKDLNGDPENSADIGLKGRMTALETLVGDKSVETQISDALKVEGENGVKVDKYALAADLVATNTEVATKANDADLAAIAKTGSTDNLIQGAMTLVFDCGGAV